MSSVGINGQRFFAGSLAAGRRRGDECCLWNGIAKHCFSVRHRWETKRGSDTEIMEVKGEVCPAAADLCDCAMTLNTCNICHDLANGTSFPSAARPHVIHQWEAQ